MLSPSLDCGCTGLLSV